MCNSFLPMELHFQICCHSHSRRGLQGNQRCGFTSRRWTKLMCLKQLLVLKESFQIALGLFATGSTSTIACRPHSVRVDLRKLDVADTVFISLSRNGLCCCTDSDKRTEALQKAVPLLMNATAGRCLHTQQVQDHTRAYVAL